MSDESLHREAEAAGRRVDSYQDTVRRMEPDIAFIDAAAGWASIAISLKRIADAMQPNESGAIEDKPPDESLRRAHLSAIEHHLARIDARLIGIEMQNPNRFYPSWTGGAGAPPTQGDAREQAYRGGLWHGTNQEILRSMQEPPYTVEGIRAQQDRQAAKVAMQTTQPDTPPTTDWSALPQWRCHKVVKAAPIMVIQDTSRTLTLHLADVFVTLDIGGATAFLLPAKIFARGRPEIPPDMPAADRPMLVVYDDGYVSWSPRKAFEEGYSLIDKGRSDG